MSVPEPKPKNRGVVIPDLLIEYLRGYDNSQAAVKLIQDRDAFGRSKYGQPLMSQDGRDSVEDAMQEIGDCMQYLYKAHVNGENVDRIREVIPFLLHLLDDNVIS